MDGTPEKSRLLNALRAANLTPASRIDMIGRVVGETSSGNRTAVADALAQGTMPRCGKGNPQQQRLQLRLLIAAGVPWAEFEPLLLALVHETSDCADVTHYIEMAVVAGDCSAVLRLIGELSRDAVARAWDSIHPRVRQNLIEWVARDDRSSGHISIGPFVGMLVERHRLRAGHASQSKSAGEHRVLDSEVTPGEYLLLSKFLLQSCSGQAVASFVIESLSAILNDLRKALCMDADQVNGILTGLAEHCSWVGAYSAVRALLIDFPEEVQMSSRQMALLAEAAAALHPAAEKLWSETVQNQSLEANQWLAGAQTTDWRMELQNALNAQSAIVRPNEREMARSREVTAHFSDSPLIPDRSVRSLMEFLQRNASLSPSVLMRLAQHEADCDHPAQALEVLRFLGSRWHYTNRALLLFVKLAIDCDDRELAEEAQMILGLRREWGELGEFAPKDIFSGSTATYGVRQPRQELTESVMAMWGEVVPNSVTLQSKKMEKEQSQQNRTSPSLRFKMAANELSAAAAVCRQIDLAALSWRAEDEMSASMPRFIDSFIENPWTRIFLYLHEALAASSSTPEMAFLLTTVCCGNGAAAMASLESMRVPLSVRWKMESWLLSRLRFDPSSLTRL